MAALRNGEHPVTLNHRWAVILAGGDGKRLLPLTRKLTGDNTPKQFCALTGGETLLDVTSRRVAQVVPARNTLLLLTRTHERFYADRLPPLSPSSVLIQPYNHGTAAAIAYAVTRLATLAPDAVVAFFPSDHHFQCEEAFAAATDRAFMHAQVDADRVVLLGIVPSSAESAYGWIEPGAQLHRTGEAPVFEVRRFWEKPAHRTAERLLDCGCLWNSFVMVGRVRAFLNMLRRGTPDIVSAFEMIGSDVEPSGADSMLRHLYAQIPSRSFSDDVLSTCPSQLAVLPVHGVGWTDLGEPQRAQAALGIPTTARSSLAGEW
ncbi:MAG TPA: sugar phosphate nucleotidyltransferase [Bryobacteraceae bacterium]|nr:sugar phosphate nucleotidyltransferase [Bryobacteraceae bacterium]